jgi:hypothetical protein
MTLGETLKNIEKSGCEEDGERARNEALRNRSPCRHLQVRGSVFGFRIHLTRAESVDMIAV